MGLVKPLWVLPTGLVKYPAQLAVSVVASKPCPVQMSTPSDYKSCHPGAEPTSGFNTGLGVLYQGERVI